MNSFSPFQNSSATDTSPFSDFWGLVSAAASTGSKFYFFNDFLFDDWIYERRERDQLHPSELSVHGMMLKGKLKAPKIKPPRGYRHVYVQRHEFAGPHFR